MKKNILLILVVFSLFGREEKDVFLKRIESHFILDDSYSALKEAEKGLSLYPKSLEINKAYLKALARCGEETKAIKILNNLPSYLKSLKEEPSLLEDVSWSILKKGINSSQYATRLSSLIGIYFTRDAKAVNILKTTMKDSNAILRAVSVQLATSYLDQPLKEIIEELLLKEKVWLVRLELLKAIGQMKIKEKTYFLKEVLKNNNATFEERIFAIDSLIKILEEVDLEELVILLESPYAGLRCLGCELATHFKRLAVKNKILNLTLDPRSDVRIAALNALVLFFKDDLEKDQVRASLEKLYEDSNAFVAITAAWAGLVVDPLKGAKNLKKWLFDQYPENRRFAAAAIAQSGSYGIELAEFALDNSEDLFVKANIALGLIGQQKKIKGCCDILFSFIKNKQQMWMWDNSQNSLFKIVAPSEIRHTDHLPNYPEAIDQMVQLNILSVLSVMEDPRAQEAIKTFLKRKIWGITGLASIMLLQEGDEECLNVLRTLLQDKDEKVRIQAALALAIIGKDKKVFSILEEAYFQADHEMKLNILGAVGNISHKEAFPFLIKVLQEPFQIIKIAAASALIQAANF